MVGEWAWPEEATETKWPLTNNDILGHVVQRLRNIVHQPVVKPPPPSFPRFTIKACVLGKFCSGKTTCLAKLAAGTRHARQARDARTNTMLHHLATEMWKKFGWLNYFCLCVCVCVCVLFPGSAHGIYVLSADSLIKEALNAYRNGEEVSLVLDNFIVTSLVSLFI